MRFRVTFDHDEVRTQRRLRVAALVFRLRGVAFPFGARSAVWPFCIFPRPFASDTCLFTLSAPCCFLARSSSGYGCAEGRHVLLGMGLYFCCTHFGFQSAVFYDLVVVSLVCIIEWRATEHTRSLACVMRLVYLALLAAAGFCTQRAHSTMHGCAEGT